MSVIKGESVSIEVLENYLKHATKEEEKLFFKLILPFIKNMILQTPHLFVNGVPMLYQSKCKKIGDLKKLANEIVLTKEQCACILSNAFFSTFHRNLISLLPSINFDHLLQGNDSSSVELKTEKLKMLMNYFTRIASEKSIFNFTY
jgi:hypothetical protein